MNRRLIFVLGILFVSVAASASAIEQVMLRLSIPKTEILVGEPCVVVVSIETAASVEVPLSLGWRDARLQILIDRGQGFVPHVEEQWATEARAEKGMQLGGRALAEYVLSYDASRKAPPFASPGTYRVVAEYRDAEAGLLARSNEVAVIVRVPEGAERQVYDALQSVGPQTLGVHIPSPTTPGTASWFSNYPDSAYLQELRLNELAFKLNMVRNGYDKDTVSPPAGAQPDVRSGGLRARARDLIPEAMNASAVAGPFQPNALLLLGTVYELAGDAAAADATYQRTIAEFPTRQAAQEARQRLNDTTPPNLDVTVTPSTLWPPDHKLVPITVAVKVSDDTDPNPGVKLVSITCDDGCDPSADVAGATLNTDDRQFQLRADRFGTGSGRTYTITYSATDASGNTATKTTTVTVPHDQRVGNG